MVWNAYPLFLLALIAFLALPLFSRRRDRLRRWRRPLSRLIFAACIAWVSLLYVMTLSTDPRKTAVTVVRAPVSGQSTIVLLHGWNGNQDTWGRLPELLIEDPRFSGVGLVRIDYPTLLATAGASISAIARDAGMALEVVTARSLVIVTHSMGGVVVRQALLDERLTAASRTTLLLSVASPHGGLAAAGVVPELGVTPATMDDLRYGSKFLTALERGWNLAAQQSKWAGLLYVCVASRDDELVEPSSALRGCPDRRYLDGWSHREIVKPTSAEDPRYQMLSAIMTTGITKSAQAQ